MTTPMRPEARATTRGGDRSVVARGAAGAAAPLVTTAHNPSPADQRARRQAWRDDAWRLRKGLWEVSGLARVRNCGRVTHGGAGGPALRLSGDGDGRRAGIAGLQSCGSPWSCPVCSRKIASERAEELSRVVQVVADQGGAGALVTLTLRHNRSHSLRACWDALTYAWGKVTSGKHHRAEIEQFGVIGWARAVEVTYGEQSGWHAHIHAVLLLDAPTSPEMLEELAARWWQRWERALGRRGFTASAENGGLDCRSIEMTADTPGAVARYFNKIGTELAGHTMKHGRRGNRSMFQVLADGLDTSLADDIERWNEYETVSRGRRQMTWSRGLRDWAEVGRRRSDEEIVDEDEGGETVLFIAPESWPAVRDRVTDLLAVAERAGVAGAQAWLTERGLSWHQPPQPRC